jgi:hypothetical protein
MTTVYSANNGGCRRASMAAALTRSKRCGSDRVEVAMERVVLAFIMILSFLFVIFWTLFAHDRHGTNAWPFTAIVATSAIGLGLAGRSKG